MHIDWKASFSASCFHAAWAVAGRQPLTDPLLADVLAQPAAAVHQEFSQWKLGPDAAWQTVIFLAAATSQIEGGSDDSLAGPGGSNRKDAAGPPVADRSPFPPAIHPLASAIVHACGEGEGERTAARLGVFFGEIESAVQQARPRLDAELKLRTGPLRQLWEARGPGLLRRIAHWTDERVLVRLADVLLVHPVLGGYGRVHFPQQGVRLPQQGVRLEALLTNPVAELPEVVRLGWLLSQLQPMRSGGTGRDARILAALAMLPPALQAAEEVELVRLDPALLAQAMSLWKLPQPLGTHTATQLWDWWQDYQHARPAWRDALAALSQIAAAG